MYNTDWQKEVLRTSKSQDYKGGASTARPGFLPTASTQATPTREGILTSSMQRVTAGFSLSPKFFNDLLSVNVNVNALMAAHTTLTAMQ